MAYSRMLFVDAFSQKLRNFHAINGKPKEIKSVERMPNGRKDGPH